MRTWAVSAWLPSSGGASHRFPDRLSLAESVMMVVVVMAGM